MVFKAHNAHPGTGELVGQAIAKAVRDTGLHPGVFSLIYGPGSSIGQALVADPAIKAVGFTGSQSAGIALMRTAAARPEPIPVYAEMSSLNPVFVFPGALAGNAEEISALAQQYVTAVTGSSGQLCTSPGLLFAPAGAAGDAFAAAVGRAVSACAGQTMLTEGIAGSWNAGAEALGSAENVSVVGQGADGATKNAPAPPSSARLSPSSCPTPCCTQEIFGAASLVIRYSTTEELVDAANRLEGQLTASLQLTEADYRGGGTASSRSWSRRSAGSSSTAGPPASRSATPWSTAARSPPHRTPAPPPWARWRSTGSCGPSPTRTCRRNCSRCRCRTPTPGG